MKHIMKVTADLSLKDKLGMVKVRLGLHRDSYKVEPGLYMLGKPNNSSFIFVSANYKYSFDVLRSNLKGVDAWVLVLDTKGINVWCAAGKGTFGTDELVERIKKVELEKFVKHRKLIVPQLGAVGIAAHEVKKRTDFSVIYGPVRAKDIHAFLEGGLKATTEMREVTFTLYERMLLVPLEFVLGFKYLIFISSIWLIAAGFSKSGFSVDLAINNGIYFVLNLVVAYICGTIIGPLLLPWLPGRSFSFKGLFIGICAFLMMYYWGFVGSKIDSIAWLLLYSAISSFLTMNFTGASTYTSISGVKKEMKIAVPLQLIAFAIGIIILLVTRFI
jgi:hypothetical protein